MTGVNHGRRAHQEIFRSSSLKAKSHNECKPQAAHHTADRPVKQTSAGVAQKMKIPEHDQKDSLGDKDLEQTVQKQ